MRDRDNPVKAGPNWQQCMDEKCKHKFPIGRKSASHAARPKCPACGNGQLEPYVKNKVEPEPITA